MRRTISKMFKKTEIKLLKDQKQEFNGTLLWYRFYVHILQNFVVVSPASIEINNHNKDHIGGLNHLNLEHRQMITRNITNKSQELTICPMKMTNYNQKTSNFYLKIKIQRRKDQNAIYSKSGRGVQTSRRNIGLCIHNSNQPMKN